MASAEEIANITSENGRHKTECNENDYDARFDFLWKRRSIEKLEGVVYTEDDIPVRTLYISNIYSDKANNDYLEDFFSKYGNVESVKIFGRPSWGKCTAFVTFIDAKDAANVLGQTEDIDEFRISSAYSWHQPKAPSTLDTENADESAESENQNKSDCIMRLNDDCLMEIFSYLDLIDLTKTSKVCQRFAALSENIFKTHEHIDSMFLRDYMDITLMEWKDVLQTMGHHVKYLYMKPQSFLNPPGIKVFEMVSCYCSNLESLGLEEFPLTRHTYKLKPLLKRLKSLSLDNCTVKQNFTDMFNSSWQLETLHFKKSYEITGARLDRLIHLKSISFTACGNIQPKYLSQLLQQQSNLETLSLICCDRITSTIFRDIALYSIKLKKFTVEFTPGLRACRELDLPYLANLPQLTNLHFECDTNVNISKLMISLATKNLLEELDISCRTIDNQSFEAILECTNLKILRINRTNVSKKWLFKIANSLVNLEELHMIHCADVHDDGFEKLISHAKKLKLIDISRTSVTPDGLESCAKILYEQFGKRPLLEVWWSAMEIRNLEKERNMLKPYQNVIKVDFGVARQLDVFFKYFCKPPDSDSSSSDESSNYDSDNFYEIYFQ